MIPPGHWRFPIWLFPADGWWRLPGVKPLNRRDFLGAAGAAATLALAPSSASAQATAVSSPAPSPRKIRVGVIGCGWYGLVITKAAFKAGGVEVLGLCDVDSAVLSKAAQEVAGLQDGVAPKTFKHYAELLALPGLEAIFLATPPQWHALPFLAALDRGLDIYCEKPLAYDVREGRVMADAAARSKRIVQIGFQRRKGAALQAVRRFIAEGGLGRVVQVDAQIHYTARLLSPAAEPPPASLDWDLWCGPAPLLPYSPQIGHLAWRLEKTTGHGHLVDWGIHLIDAARTILDLGAPRKVTAAGGLYQLQGRITTPDTLTAFFEFDRCPLSWRHRIWGAEEVAPDMNNGLTIFGEKGSVFVADNRWTFIPAGKNAERVVNDARADVATLHMGEFLDCVRTRTPASCSTADAHLSTTTVQLAMIALETGSRLNWDAAKETVVGNPAANALLRRAYRAPWVHPYRA
jgi:predicted dehydrogenase